MKKVILESPFAGDVARNIEYARQCMLDCLMRNESPIVSHLLYTQVLDDKIPEDRRLGIDAGLAWIDSADKHVFYIDYGYSNGMNYAKEYAIKNGIVIEERMIL